jgi:photosystem II stability/assembly factor-like uncharacterized protein
VPGVNLLMKSRTTQGISLYLLVAIAVLFPIVSATGAMAAQWPVLGPDGGDVRSLTYDPHNPDRILLGTSTSTLFLSQDGGHSWARFAHLGDSDDYVLDHIVMDPKNANTIYVSAWSVNNQQSGDVFRSKDGGKSWQTLPEVHGKSVRALAMSASDDKVLVAGALDGVFRTQNGGNGWQRISAFTPEVKNVESIAIDPKNPNVIYAGTWHLAWKTSDGGVSWQHINKGMIDDSDVFSVIVNSDNPSVVFASACSGIYKSETAGELFAKIQGIPFTARRTRVLKQDPSNPSIVYAGTTEGLWKSTDLGKSWKHASGSEIVVNDVLVDPRDSKRVLLATDRGGVLASEDGAQTFTASNHGYTHRYVTAILTDKNDPNTMLVGLSNDREWGGVFATHDGGQHWTQKSDGLGGRDVMTLKQASNGDVVAGTNRGIFLLAHNASQWKPINTIINVKSSPVRGKKGARKAPAAGVASRSVLEARVNEIEITKQHWYAATSAGLFSSVNEGKSWSGGPVAGKQDFVSVQAHGELVVAATRTNVMASKNGGNTWQQGSLPPFVMSIRSVTVTPDSDALVASREGAFRSSDSGATWQRMLNGLPDKDINSITYDENASRLLATSTATGVIFESQDGGRSWRRGPDSGYTLRNVHVVRGHFVASTPFDGVIVQPENEARSASAGLGSN